jgi:hypothetical protein
MRRPGTKHVRQDLFFLEIGAGQGGEQPGAAAYIHAELTDAEVAIVSTIKAIRYE